MERTPHCCEEQIALRTVWGEILSNMKLCMCVSLCQSILQNIWGPECVAVSPWLTLSILSYCNSSDIFRHFLILILIDFYRVSFVLLLLQVNSVEKKETEFLKSVTRVSLLCIIQPVNLFIFLQDMLDFGNIWLWACTGC